VNGPGARISLARRALETAAAPWGAWGPTGTLPMAKRTRTPAVSGNPPGRPLGRNRRPGIVHTSVYLPEAVHEALRVAAFKERVKIHDIVLEGIEMALRKRGRRK
jgi:hypothetical protein